MNNVYEFDRIKENEERRKRDSDMAKRACDNLSRATLLIRYIEDKRTLDANDNLFYLYATLALTAQCCMDSMNHLLKEVL